jgi:hypothetical protein
MLADTLSEIESVIAANHMQDADGFPVINDPDLADAMRALSHAVTVLSRLAYRIGQDDARPL